MRIQDPLRGGRASRLATGLFLAFHLAATPLAAAAAGGTEVVDPVNGFSLVLPAGWSASVPKPGAVDGATVLRWREPGALPANLQEGEVTGGSLKIQLTAVERDRYLEGGGIADTSRFRVASERPLATRIAGLHAVVSTRTGASGASRLEVALSAADDRVLIADLMPIGSPRLAEALAILETLRVEGVAGEPAPTAASAAARAAGLAERVAPPAPSAAGGLQVTSPVAASILVSSGWYRAAWSPFACDQPGCDETADLLLDDGTTATPISSVRDDGLAEWRVPEGTAPGAYQLEVVGSGGSGRSAPFRIQGDCGGGSHAGTEAPISPIELHVPFQFGTSWAVGRSGSFYGSGFHCNGIDDYYATDWNATEGPDEGEPVLAVAEGTVGEMEPCQSDGLGCWVTLNHAEGVSTTYGHLQARYVHEGQFVHVGHHLGDVGDTGTAYGTHLHLRFRVAGQSRCSNVAGPRCPNDEEPRPGQSPKPSPMWSWTGSGKEKAELVGSGTYRAANGIGITEPGGDQVLEAGQVVTIRWLTEVVQIVDVELTRGDQRWVLFHNIPNAAGKVMWTVPATLPCGTGYRIRVVSTEDPGVYGLGEELAIHVPSCGLSLHPPTLPNAIQNEDYWQRLVFFGGTPPWRMQIGTGALPADLVLDEEGVLHGNPTKEGTAEFSVVARDSVDAIVEREYTLTIRQALPEACNGLDDDGDRSVDEGNVCLCRTAEYTGFEYHFCDAAVDWYDAQRACSALGAELVKVESSNENNWLAAEGSSLNRWIGLTDAAAEEDWRWTDGSPLGTFHGWGPAEPNGGTSENCAQLYFENSEWNDLWCGWSSGLVNGFVCQETIVPSDFLCLTGRLIYNDPYYGIFTGPVDHPVELSIDSPGPGWTPIGQLTPNAAGRFCRAVLWERRYLLSEEVTGPPGHVRFCQAVIEPTDPNASGTCGEQESGCEELGDVDFFCGS